MSAAKVTTAPSPAPSASPSSAEQQQQEEAAKALSALSKLSKLDAPAWGTAAGALQSLAAEAAAQAACDSGDQDSCDGGGGAWHCSAWSTPSPTNLPDSHSRTCTAQLADGRTWLVGAQLPRSGQRTPLTLALSSAGILTKDPVVIFVLCLESCVPSATSPIGLLTSWGKHELAQNLSMIYLPQHLFCAFTMSAVCVLSMSIIPVGEGMPGLAQNVTA